jgi:hypothetical protein
MHAAEEPQCDQDYYDNGQNASQAGSAITSIAVIATTATEYQQQNDNDQNQAQGTPSWSIARAIFNGKK